jgi:hypothetical protein
MADVVNQLLVEDNASIYKVRNASIDKVRTANLLRFVSFVCLTRLSPTDLQLHFWASLHSFAARFGND